MSLPFSFRMFGPVTVFMLIGSAFAADLPKYDYRVWATNKTSTMEKELNEGADSGFQFESAMGGETAFGGKEVVVVMSKVIGGSSPAKLKYQLLATSKTSTMLKELQRAGDEGFEYRGQTVFESAMAGREVAVIMERDTSKPGNKIEYKLLSTTKTSTMQKELQDAGAKGFKILGFTIGKTAFGGSETLTILRRNGQ